MCCLCQHQQLFPLFCSDTASGPSPLCPPQLATPYSLCSPHPLVGQGRQSCVESWCILTCELWWSGCSHSSGLLLRQCLNKCQQWLLLPHPGSASHVVSICPFCPAWRANQGSHAPQEQSPGFPQPSCKSQLSNRPSRLISPV